MYERYEKANRFKTRLIDVDKSFADALEMHMREVELYS